MKHVILRRMVSFLLSAYILLAFAATLSLSFSEEQVIFRATITFGELRIAHFLFLIASPFLCIRGTIYKTLSRADPKKMKRHPNLCKRFNFYLLVQESLEEDDAASSCTLSQITGHRG